MAPAKFLHILSVVSLAVLHASFGALPVNALALERSHAARGLGHAHADIAKRADSKKCRPRPSVSPNAVALTTSPVPSSQSSQPAQTTTSSQPPPANTPSSSDGSKFIIGWSNEEESSLKNFVPKGSQAQTIFNWALDYGPDAADVFGPSYATFQTLEYVPSVSPEDASQLAGALKSNTRYIRTWNEPEIQGQANISPGVGVDLWMKYIEPVLNANPNVVALAPAITGSDMGMSWLASFSQQCDGKCSFKKLDVHFYTTDISSVTPVIVKMHDTYNMPIWITEFGCHNYVDPQNNPCTQDVFNTLYDAIMPYVASTSFIEKFGWFGFFNGNELPAQVEAVNSFMDCDSPSPNCGPNDVGKKFINGVTTL